MDRKQMCVANVRYHKPTEKGQKKAKNMTKYLTYREGRDEVARQVSGKERWDDHGMGSSVARIIDTCDGYRSDHVWMFSLVINPNPDLIAMIPHEEREQFVNDLTYNTVEDFFDARDIDTGVEWSAVLHHRMTDDKEAPGRHNPHTHVILPGTYYHEFEGQRVPLYFSKNKSVNHIEMLHDVTESTMGNLLERYVGPEWEQRYDALDAKREEQRQVTEYQHHGIHVEDELVVPFWCGTRMVSESNCAIGYYMPLADDDEVNIEFRPVAVGLEAEQAKRLSAFLGRELRENPELDDQLERYIETVKTLLDDEDFDLTKLPEVQEQPLPQTVTNTWDLDR